MSDSYRETAVIVGRFQPFHIGHTQLLEYCFNHYDDTVILLGEDPNGRTKRNPLNIEERKDLLTFLFETISIEPVVENFNSTLKFRQNVQEALSILDTNEKLVLVTENETTINSLKPLFSRIDTPPRPLCRGKIIRERIQSGEDWKHLIPKEAISILEKHNFTEIVQNKVN